ncbi:MAG: NHLP leader peptide family natural product precursor [Planctomycetia bacterium]|nr:NHLP leader peptide family natural product precursor [Planctomycetia bacterium]
MPSFEELIFNPEFRQRFIDNPQEAAGEAGLSVPSGVKLVVHEDTATEMNLVLGGPMEGLPEELQNLVLKAQDDAAFKSRLIRDPVTTARAETGFVFPPELKVCVYENTAGTTHVVLPAVESAEGELNDRQLEQVAGGMSAQQRAQFVAQMVADATRQSRQVGLGSINRNNRR